MGCPRKNSFRAIPYFLIFFLLTATGMPYSALSQEATTTQETATSTPDVPVSETNIATSTTNATSTGETPVPGGPIVEGGGQVLGESTVDEEESVPEEPDQPVINDNTPSPPQLSVRELRKRVIADRHAFHSCEAETFRIDVSSKASARARIMLRRDTDAPYEIEIGSLPYGIDMRFSKNSAYQYAQGANEKYLDLEINNQSGSQKGNFTIPVIYTRKGGNDSSVICQINIVNQ